MRQFLEEWAHLIGGKLVYLLLFVPLAGALVFSYVFQSSQVNEAPMAVVDLDRSSYSTQLINKLNASQYIDVKAVYHQAIEADALLYNERFLGVLYLPQGLEAGRAQGQASNLGFYVDMTQAAAVGNLRSAVSEVVATENAAYGVGRLKATGLTDGQASTVLSHLSVQQRQLYNPTNSMLPTSVFGFVNTLLIALFGSATLGIVPRLRNEGKLNESLESPLAVALRVLPYALVMSVSLYLAVGLLKQVGGMRFEASPFQVWLPFLMYTGSLGLMGMLIGWNAPSPAKAGGRTLFIIVPAFLLGGTLVPVAMLPGPLQLLSALVPISWHFKFVRGLGLRGGDLGHFMPELGSFLLLMGAMLVGILLLTLMEHRRAKSAGEEPGANEETEELAAVGSDSTGTVPMAGRLETP